MWTQRTFVMCCLLAASACATVARPRRTPKPWPEPEVIVSGGAMLGVQPEVSFKLVGEYDFELLGPIRGKACVSRTDDRGAVRTYWSGPFQLEAKLPRDSLTVGAIAAASTEAIDSIVGADTMLFTRVITEGKSGDEVCAYVYGRAVKLRKAGTSDEASSAP